jgi:Double zinc ribbon
MTRPDPSLRGQRSVRTFLRVGGPILLAIGLLLTIAGMVSFFSAFGSFDMPSNFWMAFIGLPLIAVGAAMTRIGYLGPATRYVAGEVTPTIRDTLGALGITSATVACPTCGASNDADARFCDSCGKPLSARCASCGAANDPDARFCDACGAALPAA